MKMDKSVNKMAFHVLEKFKLSHFSAELQQKLKFSATIFKVYYIKRENAFENLNHVSFLT